MNCLVFQIERLKYFYAIVTCDSVETADILYKDLDGVEYQLSSSVGFKNISLCLRNISKIYPCVLGARFTLRSR